jgi:predicted ABC-class ATPase
MYIERQKGTVWDYRKRDLSYIDHRNAMKKIKKKVDNDCPVISSRKFFPQMKYIAKQWKMEERIRGNLLILRELNKIQRSRVRNFYF